MLLPVLFALGAALSNALATVLQRKAALTVPKSEGLRLGLILDLLRRPVWLAGIATVITAGVCQAVALATGPITIVQPLFVLELPLALVVAAALLQGRLSRAGWLAVGTVVVGLGIVLFAASPAGNRTQVPMTHWIPAVAVCVAAIAALVVAALRRPEGRGRAACFGLATAISYAMTAALMKTSMHTLDDVGVTAFFTAWQTYGFALFGVCALFFLENAMQSGPLVASQPALTLGDACVSLALGITVYEEYVRTGWWLIPQLLGAALIAAGVLALSRLPLARALTTEDTEQPGEGTAADAGTPAP
ncbi:MULTISPECIES: DMT family transporter [unclassified Streptomyces]|jgi:drug/metabolite transporter (DMT)-like permease|uniref:DMT family transporter n=1 Tax=unclassified Streptomyces TaxID=2593676 RepID=UPI00144636A5|nr:DMT family transporter [Streptomyces cellulosae]WSB82493.1 DMT family transporter [Streptomyces cellulosae]WSB89253.1 DMT family transporter [Streptomyces cellulosae]WTB67463.1 DMT family transporter [Streptomyces cellulosae]WTC20627.1 DMT family transporter [Streptomyces cellulosae]